MAIATTSFARTVQRTTYFRPRSARLAGATQRFRAPVNHDVEVRLRAAPDAAPYFLCQRYHITQRIVDEGSDGSLVISFNVDQLDAVEQWAGLWGKSLLVVDVRSLAPSF